MTGITHHIPDDLLMGYAAGSLPPAFDLVVATHVSLSDDARARLAGYEELGGVVLSDLEEARIAEDSLERTLARISGEPRRAARPEVSRGIFPEPLRKVVGGDEDAVKWRGLGMGAKQCVLQSDDGASARLLFIPAGQAMPEHGHGGMELTLVLKGAYSDGDKRFSRGDVEFADEDLDHMPVAEPGEDCICLVATDSRLRFKGWLPRIAQRFIGI
ncbi:ChrR family anti-sigma-E factor [Roseibacterium sp. SDUM158017]|uniref:ChrR family anti-sigma-E factor n=1 Tax=Roseicyclus salinarum TaxID=3036773 RepID=UPI0024150CB2|nr:ChrR family anti-sigma-E factor [Roseibacterium sp. SDUM158017]MDG4650471.1 ChrR family anti-sigma-E factor [Roseibacterium sp. SDUM158017]